MADCRDYNNGIYAIDTGYVRPLLAAIHLVVHDGRAAFIDTGTYASLGNAKAALAGLGLGDEAVDYVILTHVHLDHAGGAGAMMEAFPAAKLVVHPRGARHMADPSRLLAGVREVYGAEYVERMYGHIPPIPVERIIEAPDGLSISLAGRGLRCLDTPGHARHHICIVDEATGGIFSGDMFGLSYREMDVGDRQFIFPTTTPTQFEPEAMHRSIDRLLALNPEAIYLTHYSRVHDVQSLGTDLHRRLIAHVDIARAANGGADGRHERIREALTGYLLAEARTYGCMLSDRELLDIWGGDLELNAQGLGVWLDSVDS